MFMGFCVRGLGLYLWGLMMAAGLATCNVGLNQPSVAALAIIYQMDPARRADMGHLGCKT